MKRNPTESELGRRMLLAARNLQPKRSIPRRLQRHKQGSTGWGLDVVMFCISMFGRCGLNIILMGLVWNVSQIKVTCDTGLLFEMSNSAYTLSLRAKY